VVKNDNINAPASSEKTPWLIALAFNAGIMMLFALMQYTLRHL
jgi:hypothetical protein